MSVIQIYEFVYDAVYSRLNWSCVDDCKSISSFLIYSSFHGTRKSVLITKKEIQIKTLYASLCSKTFRQFKRLYSSTLLKSWEDERILSHSYRKMSYNTANRRIIQAEMWNNLVIFDSNLLKKARGQTVGFVNFLSGSTSWSAKVDRTCWTRFSPQKKVKSTESLKIFARNMLHFNKLTSECW